MSTIATSSAAGRLTRWPSRLRSRQRTRRAVRDHWTAPGTQRALSQNPEPDADHSPAFWASVAATFARDPGVIFDLFNEPYDYWGTDPDPGTAG